MKKMVTVVTILFALGLFVTGNVTAAGEQTTSQQMDMGQHHRASKLIGQEIRNQQGEELGEITDLMLDNEGNVDYLILSRGGVMGVGSNYVPIPWDAVQQPGAQEALVVNVDKSKLDKAPSFSKDEWANFNRPEWQEEVRGYYGTPDQTDEDVQVHEEPDLDMTDVVEGEEKLDDPVEGEPWDPGKNN